MIGVIYLLTSPSGKQYVGQTIQKLQKRMNGHVSSSSRHDAKINRAIKKYKLKSFKKENLITIQTSENNIFNQLDKLEILFIKIYNTYEKGYNSTMGGNTGLRTEETRKKISIGNKGKIISEEHKRKIGDAARNITTEQRKKFSDLSKGRKYPKEYGENIRKHMMGNLHGKGNRGIVKPPLSEETKQKISLKLKGVKKSKEAIEKSRLSRTGKKLSDASKQKIKDSWIIRKQNSAIKNIK